MPHDAATPLAPRDRRAVFAARGLTKVYEMGQVRVHALSGVDVDLFEREFVVLLGPSGSGKSTLLKFLGGLDVPTAGTVRYLDHDLTSDDHAELTRLRCEHVGVELARCDAATPLNME